MGGLLARVVGGALSGAGSAMVDQAKQAREDALASIKRGQEVEDRDKGYAHADTLQQNQFGHDDTSQQAIFAHADTSQQAGFAHDDSSQQAQFGQQSKLADKNIAAEGDRQAAGIKANKDAAEIAAGRYGKPEPDQNGNLIATNQNGKAITIVGADGKSVMAPNSRIPGTAIKIIADKSVDADGNFDMPTFMANMQQAEKVYGPGGQSAALPPPTQAPSGGYLSNLWGAVTGSPNQAQPTGGGLVRTPASNAAVTPPPANGPKRINNAADYNAVPSGAQYIDPAGTLRTKP